MPSYSDEDFEELGKTVRVTLEIDEQLKPNPIEFLRRLKRHGYIQEYIRVPDSALPDDEAKYSPEERIIYLRDSTYLGAENAVPHYVFTVFHEGSHALLGHQHERKRSFSEQARAERRVTSIRIDEDDANRLTAAIMAPFHRADFTLTTTADELMKRFGLSARAAALRADEMSGIYRRLYNLPRPLPPGVIDFLAGKRREGYKVTSLPPIEVAAIQPRQPKYTGESCRICGEFKMIRVGTHLKCDVKSCGALSGDD